MSLGSLGIHQPKHLSAWARKRGLLSVYLQATSPGQVFPGTWQALWPGHRTDPKAPAWHRGNKTYTWSSLKEKNHAEELIKDWASAMYEVDRWLRVHGLGGALFPDPVIAELRLYLPDLPTARAKRHSAPYQKRNG